MGQVDSFFQSLPTAPSLHVIIEPHPDVLQHMRDTGWYEKKGVRILEGKWQDFIESGSESDVLLDAGGFDAIYTDTFSEDYDGETMRLACMYDSLTIRDQTCTDSSSISRDCSPGPMPGSASSTASVPRVSAVLTARVAFAKNPRARYAVLTIVASQTRYFTTSTSICPRYTSKRSVWRYVGTSLT